jgi:hypothetical protein
MEKEKLAYGKNLVMKLVLIISYGSIEGKKGACKCYLVLFM